MELNGIAHIQLTANDAARSLPFWERLCHFFEMKTLIKNETMVYCIGSRTGVSCAKRRPRSAVRASTRTRWASTTSASARVRASTWTRSTASSSTSCARRSCTRPQEDGFAPGYYSVLFEDPDGIRVEVNFVPGRGHLDRL